MCDYFVSGVVCTIHECFAGLQEEWWRFFEMVVSRSSIYIYILFFSRSEVPRFVHMRFMSRCASHLYCLDCTDIGTADDQWDDYDNGGIDVCAGNFVMNNMIDTQVRVLMCDGEVLCQGHLLDQDDAGSLIISVSKRSDCPASCDSFYYFYYYLLFFNPIFVAGWRGCGCQGRVEKKRCGGKQHLRSEGP